MPKHRSEEELQQARDNARAELDRRRQPFTVFSKGKPGEQKTRSSRTAVLSLQVLERTRPCTGKRCGLGREEVCPIYQQARTAEAAVKLAEVLTAVPAD